MTAAHRLKGVGWFGSCVVVVLTFYLVSLQVAAERSRLEAVNARVVDAERDIRALETEFNTRANLAQLERWNGDTLALTAPVVGQFIANETALAAIDVTAGPAAGPDGSPVRTAALLVPSLAGVNLQTAVVAPTVPRQAFSPATIQTASVQVALQQPDPVRPARLVRAATPMRAIVTTAKAQAAMYRAVAVANVRPQAVAMLDRKLLSDTTLGDILSGARAEAGRRR
ncbi:hypothetical protein [Sphingomonas sp.]|jgi:hypothetical protein|uniref:hypothetical protein n=1 Tax=Sphingomonas sp. TaxID=28214 RepID=UPI002EDABDEA